MPVNIKKQLQMSCPHFSNLTTYSKQIVAYSSQMRINLLYAVFQKKAPWCLIITLANVDRFSKFFHQEICKKILYVHIAKIYT